MARYFLIALVVWSLANNAQAADKFDAWINVFAKTDFQIDTIKNTSTTSSSGRIDAQHLRGKLGDGGRLILSLQRANPGSGFHNVEDMIRTKDSLMQVIKKQAKQRFNQLKFGAYQKIPVNDGIGVALDYASTTGLDCTFIVAGVSGTATGFGTHQFLVMAWGCGQRKSAFVSYLPGSNRPTDR